MLFALIVSLCVRASLADEQIEQKKPHIVFFLADDLGWNDVSFHGSNQIPTPNIDCLGVSGMMLQNYYVTPICTPSRAALMTGKYPIHTGPAPSDHCHWAAYPEEHYLFGYISLFKLPAFLALIIWRNLGMQHTVIYGAEPRGLPLSEKILPQYLKELGYKNHLIGKWHLGSWKKEQLPLYRGFDSHTGFWTGKIDMYDHTSMEKGSWGFDFRRGFEVAHDLFGQYATDVYTNEAIKVIRSHNKSEPLFLMVGHSAVHSGNPYEFLRAPDDVIANFSNIADTQRRKFAGMLTKLDESVGKVVESLHANGLLENSIIIFSTDNGGAAAGFNNNAASNFPLRGVKNTLWEGGVRGAGLLWSPLLQEKSRAAFQRMHIVDWLPTLYSAAGGNISLLNEIDGIDQWEALSKDYKSNRTVLVHNIDDIWGSAAITVDEYKLHKGTNYNGDWDYWYGPSGREGTYDVELLYKSYAGRIIKKMGLMPSKEKILQLRSEVTIQCDKTIPSIPCNPLKSPCLFNIEEDPCEQRNLAEQEPETLRRLLQELDKINATAIPPNNKPLDPYGDPKLWGRVFTNFGDYERIHGPSC